MHASRRIRSGFSLIELVIVVVIIGIIAAIAIPRMSRGAAGAGDSALTGDLAVLRKAIDLYAAEHGGNFPSATDIVTQLTQYTDSGTGAGQASKDSTHIYGPYLQSIPKLPVGTYKGSQTILTTGTPGAAAGGWLYTASTGVIQANCADTEKDVAGNKYNGY
ncbi:MAG TPA: prepilin-type N-terminal cleavage/methylation domain-containing protein [Phycisphaerales bacterium]|jgi:prepilin-type N-terminal cleavage/methylation domain-containing protein|nr:prepilin-type N-terminal cleavage/methylation domain-containing protein [Phycisphaerales bacterium]